MTIQAVYDSFAKQRFMTTLGARLTKVDSGEVEIELPFRAELTQQTGTIHAGVISAIADSACGYAALSIMPEGAEVLSVEFKVNLLSPAKHDLFARAGIIRGGNTLTVTKCDVWSTEVQVATMIATMIRR